MGPAELRDRASRTADDPNDRERVEAFAAAPVLALPS